MHISFVFDTLTCLDNICDKVPGVSTGTNLIDIFIKATLINNLTKKTITSNNYFKHINDKSYLKCSALLFPITGNIIVLLDELDQELSTKNLHE